MDVLDKLRNRRHMGPKGQLRGIGVCKASSSASATKIKTVMDTLDQLRNQRRMGPEGQLRGIGVRKISSGTPKLSELGARAIPGWVTHWEVARKLPETKPCGHRGGPKADNIVLRRSRSRDVTIGVRKVN
ncbi:hypothetical protein L3X38_038059 [Prunus dulcis]|uniref:Uncharacterized protein n=1 Tax=Prunus dulcis TaxID=3755 RepID=A0AAD4YR20_PRUDU|nr:hypothetical protein L3X38_038059 [Prunus dulcis]